MVVHMIKSSIVIKKYNYSMFAPQNKPILPFYALAPSI